MPRWWVSQHWSARSCIDGANFYIYFTIDPATVFPGGVFNNTLRASGLDLFLNSESVNPFILNPILNDS